MKKDIEWLKDEILTDMRYLEGNRDIQQLDIKYQTLREVAQKINSLDEPEVLSEDWIEEHHYIRMDPDNPFVYVKDLKNLLVPKQEEITEEQAWEVIHGKYGDEVLQNNIDYVESQGYVVIEKPTLPPFVVEFIAERQDWANYEIFGDDYLFEEHNDVAKWLYDNAEDINRKRELDITLARNDYPYEVEEEQKYYAKIKGHELFNDSEEGYWNVDGKELYIDNAWHDYSGYKTTILTKDEWTNLGINEDNADFVKVEELEE